MTHYDLYPYPDPGLYAPEQIRFLRNNNAPTVATWDQWWPRESPRGKDVLVIGCGVYEALSVAAQEPLLKVVAIDSSKATIDISENLARNSGIANITFFHQDIMQRMHEDCFDLVIASGVMHHIKDDFRFVEIVNKQLKPRGLFSVMVYGDILRRPIADFRMVLQAMDVPLNKEGIKFTRELLRSLPLGHPVRDFWETVKQNDAQVVDLFLHPYAKQYEAGELIALLRSEGFRLVRWFNDALKVPRMLETRCAKLSDMACARVAQIVNHADAKIAGLFRKESVDATRAAPLSD